MKETFKKQKMINMRKIKAITAKWQRDKGKFSLSNAKENENYEDDIDIYDTNLDKEDKLNSVSF